MAWGPERPARPRYLASQSSLPTPHQSPTRLSSLQGPVSALSVPAVLLPRPRSGAQRRF